jgi:hypothetical protein
VSCASSPTLHTRATQTAAEMAFLYSNFIDRHYRRRVSRDVPKCTLPGAAGAHRC